MEWVKLGEELRLVDNVHVGVDEDPAHPLAPAHHHVTEVGPGLVMRVRMQSEAARKNVRCNLICPDIPFRFLGSDHRKLVQDVLHLFVRLRERQLVGRLLPHCGLLLLIIIILELLVIWRQTLEHTTNVVNTIHGEGETMRNQR